MRGRRRYRVPRRPRIPPSTSIAPVAQHRGGDTQLACDLARRPTAAHQQGDRFLLELIRKMTPSLAHSTPFCSRRSLAKVSTKSGEPQTSSGETKAVFRNASYGFLAIAVSAPRRYQSMAQNLGIFGKKLFYEAAAPAVRVSGLNRA